MTKSIPALVAIFCALAIAPASASAYVGPGSTSKQPTTTTPNYPRYNLTVSGSKLTWPNGVRFARVRAVFTYQAHAFTAPTPVVGAHVLLRVRHYKSSVYWGPVSHPAACDDVLTNASGVAECIAPMSPVTSLGEPVVEHRAWAMVGDPWNMHVEGPIV